MTGLAAARRGAGFVLAALISSLPLFARPADPAQDPGRTCFVCHADAALRAQDGRPVFVDPEAFARSVHARSAVSCVACHADLAGFEDFPHPAKLAPVSCATCHPGRWREYARSRVHGLTAPGPGSPAGVVGTVYRALTGLVAGLFFVYVAADLMRRRRGAMSRPVEAPHFLVPDGEVFERMDRIARWQHMLVIAAFSLLALTGLPLLFRAPVPLAARLAVLHRAAAAVFIVSLSWHVLRAGLTVRGRRNLRDRILGPKDLRAGASRTGAVAKLDYWAFLFGSAVMIATGVLMAAPELALELFPPAVFRALVAVHGGEAVLAVVSVLTWHAYAVHLRPGVFPMSRIWLDGRITGAELRRDHPLEYRRVVGERQSSSTATAGPEKSMMSGE
jgi:formate dehydrogenase subunit gamma